MTQLALMHGTLQRIYTEDYDSVYGHMEIVRHYIHDEYINIHFIFDKRKFNFVWDFYYVTDPDTKATTKHERYSIWTMNKKNNTINKIEYSFNDIHDGKFL